jgi:hypothetical protein
LLSIGTRSYPLATAIYAGKALPTAKVPDPPHLITGDMCDRGKPDPEPYLRGAKVLNLDPKDCKDHSGGAILVLTLKVSLWRMRRRESDPV